MDNVPNEESAGFCGLDDEFDYEVESSLFAIDIIYESELPHLISEVKRRHGVDLVSLYEQYFEVPFPRSLPSEGVQNVDMEVSNDDSDDGVELLISKMNLVPRKTVSLPKMYYICDYDDTTYVPELLPPTSDIVMIYPYGDPSDNSTDMRDVRESEQEIPTRSSSSIIQELRKDIQGKKVDLSIFRLLNIKVENLPNVDYKAKLAPFVIEYMKTMSASNLRKRNRKKPTIEVCSNDKGEYFKMSLGGTTIYTTYDRNIPGVKGKWHRFKDQFILLTGAPKVMVNSIIRMIGGHVYDVLMGWIASATASESDSEPFKKVIIEDPDASAPEDRGHSDDTIINEEVRRRYEVAMANRKKAPPVRDNLVIL